MDSAFSDGDGDGDGDGDSTSRRFKANFKQLCGVLPLYSLGSVPRQSFDAARYRL